MCEFCAPEDTDCSVCRSFDESPTTVDLKIPVETANALLDVLKALRKSDEVAHSVYASLSRNKNDLIAVIDPLKTAIENSQTPVSTGAN